MTCSSSVGKKSAVWELWSCKRGKGGGGALSINHEKMYRLLKALTVLTVNLVCHLFRACIGIKRSPMFIQHGFGGISEVHGCNYKTHIIRISIFLSNMRKMLIFLMKLCEYVMNLRTFKKFGRRHICESYSYNCSSSEWKCALKGRENKFTSMK